MTLIDLWLDDMRPAPEGWTHVKTIDEAIALLYTGNVRHCSLDHDLGACADCKTLYGKTPEEWLHNSNFQTMPNCEHFGTGYMLVRWMYETNTWPLEIPKVHSSNKEGRNKMLSLINAEWERRNRNWSNI